MKIYEKIQFLLARLFGRKIVAIDWDATCISYIYRWKQYVHKFIIR